VGSFSQGLKTVTKSKPFSPILGEIIVHNDIFLHNERNSFLKVSTFSPVIGAHAIIIT